MDKREWGIVGVYAANILIAIMQIFLPTWQLMHIPVSIIVPFMPPYFSFTCSGWVIMILGVNILAVCMIARDAFLSEEVQS